MNIFCIFLKKCCNVKKKFRNAIKYIFLYVYKSNSQFLYENFIIFQKYFKFFLFLYLKNHLFLLI